MHQAQKIAAWGLRTAALLPTPRSLGFQPCLPHDTRVALFCCRAGRSVMYEPIISLAREGCRTAGVFQTSLPVPAKNHSQASSPGSLLGVPYGFPIFSTFPSVPKASPTSFSGPVLAPYNRQSVRFKMVKSSAYHRRSRASPTGQTQKAHVGPRRLSAEYVTPGVLLVKQRRYIAWGFESKRRNRHRKMYPGENVGVAKDSSLVSLVHGRVKYTHDVERDVLLCNVLPEPREELLREDLWRYRTEHVASKEENRHICHLRMKATRSFPKELVNPPTKPLPRPKFLSRFDQWQNPTLQDAPPLCDDR